MANNDVDIFLSYSRADSEVALWFARRLGELEFNVYMDTVSNEVGGDFEKTLEAALDGSKVVLSLWSKKALESEFVRNECARGASEGKLVPVAIEEIDDSFVPVRLSSIHWENMRLDGAIGKERKGISESSRVAWAKILDRIGKLTNRTDLQTDEMLEPKPLRVLLLDDRPGDALLFLDPLMRNMGARKQADDKLSAEAKSIGCLEEDAHFEEKYLWAAGCGEFIDVIFTCNGTSKKLLKECICSRSFLWNFDLILIDKNWEDAIEKWDVADFENLGMDFRNAGLESAGMVLSKVISSTLGPRSNRLIAIHTNDPPRAEIVRQALDSGAHNFMKKQQWVELCNLLLCGLRIMYRPLDQSVRGA